MSAATRSVILLVITVIAASLGLPASAEDMSFDYRKVLPRDDAYWEGRCLQPTVVQYTVDTATFVAPFHRGCGYHGRVLVTATMTRKESSSLYNDDKNPSTVTATMECPADIKCEFPVSMSHPDWEYNASYTMHWEALGLDPWPENPTGMGYWAYKGYATYCSSHGLVGECRYSYYVVRIPDI